MQVKCQYLYEKLQISEKRRICSSLIQSVTHGMKSMHEDISVFINIQDFNKINVTS
jgi:hypothetical protein